MHITFFDQGQIQLIEYDLERERDLQSVDWRLRLKFPETQLFPLF